MANYSTVDCLCFFDSDVICSAWGAYSMQLSSKIAKKFVQKIVIFVGLYSFCCATQASSYISDDTQYILAALQIHNFHLILLWIFGENII